MSQKDDDILLQSFPDNVRSNPSMYIGDNSDPSKLLSEITDNAFDEVRHGNEFVSITTEGSHYVIADAGRGIPIKKVIPIKDMPSQFVNSSQADLSIGTLHSGTKFTKSDIASGTHGVGSSCCNALSTEYILLATTGNKHEKVTEMHEDLQKIYKGEDYHYVHYKFGLRQSLGFINLGDFEGKFGFKLPDFKFKPSTIVAFQPDPTMFSSTVASLPNTLKYVATMNKLLKRKLTVYINGEVVDLHLGDFGSNIQGSIINASTIDEFRTRNPKFDIYASFGVNKNWGMKECTGSVNGLYTPRGLHIRAFTTAFSTAWTGYYGNANGIEFSSLNYWVIGLAQNPKFDSQTKVNCCTIQGINVDSSASLVKAITKEFKNHPEVWDEYAAKVRTQIQNSKDLSRVDYIRSKVVIAAENKKANRFLPAKLRDCTTNKREDAELILCEGRSAEGSVLQARNPSIHAILPLRGVPLNGVRLSLDEVLNNAELRDYISSIGLGVDEHYNLSKIRYGKVIICTDADADGFAIASSICATTIKHMRFLIENGFLYIAKAPLYGQDGKFFYDEEEYKLIDKKREFIRFKGLGSMDPIEFREAILNPKNRRLVKVTLEGAADALRIINSTSGRKDLMLEYGVIKTSLYGEDVNA